MKFGEDNLKYLSGIRLLNDLAESLGFFLECSGFSGKVFPRRFMRYHQGDFMYENYRIRRKTGLFSSEDVADNFYLGGNKDYFKVVINPSLNSRIYRKALVNCLNCLLMEQEYEFDEVKWINGKTIKRFNRLES